MYRLLALLCSLASIGAAANPPPISGFLQNNADPLNGGLLWPGEIPGQQNELAAIAAALGTAPSGVILSAGAETPWLLAGLLPQANGLVVVGAGKTHLNYAHVVAALLHNATSPANYVSLRLAAEHHFWMDNLIPVSDETLNYLAPALVTLFSRTVFNWWQTNFVPKTAEYWNGFSYLFQKEFKLKSPHFEPSLSYVYDPTHFDRVQKLLADRVVHIAEAPDQSLKGGILEPSVLKSTKEALRAWNRRVSVINLGITPAKTSEEMRQLLDLLAEKLGDRLDPNAVVLVSLPQKGDYYGAFQGAVRALFQYDHFAFRLNEARSKTRQFALELMHRPTRVVAKTWGGYGSATLDVPTADSYRLGLRALNGEFDGVRGWARWCAEKLLGQ